MTVWVDTREKKDKILDILSEIDINFSLFEFKKLDYGDYLIENGDYKILIERKEIGDFCANYVELKNRMRKMRELCDLTGLLIEGNYILQNGKIFLWRGSECCQSISLKTYHNYITSQQIRGSLFYRTGSLNETLQLLEYLHDYLPNAGKRTETKSHGKELACMMFGIGPKKVDEIAQKYGSLSEALKYLDEWTTPRMLERLQWK